MTAQDEYKDERGIHIRALQAVGENDLHVCVICH